MAKSKHFTTSDGQEFYTENHARNHARTLTDKTVTHPGEAINDIEVVDAKIEVAAVKTDETPEINLRRMNKAQLVAFAGEQKITIDETATNAVIIATIEANTAPVVAINAEQANLTVNPIAEELLTEEVVVNEEVPAVITPEPTDNTQE
jgi:hypothetical protein